MSLFSDPNEAVRRQNLKALEDKRLAFAQRMKQEGFMPEKMLFFQMDDGGLIALCAYAGRKCLITSPALGSEKDFALHRFESYPVRSEEFNIPAEGLGGIMGFGKKGQYGVNYIFTLDSGEELTMPVVAARTAWMEKTYKKNPLFGIKRRRGDANVVWEMAPLDNGSLKRALERAEAYLK